MIYNTESSLFQSFLSSGKHKPTSDEVIDALNVIKAETPNRSPEQMAATLRASTRSGCSRTWTGQNSAARWATTTKLGAATARRRRS